MNLSRCFGPCLILVWLACSFGCETDASRDQEIWNQYQPMVVVGRALAHAAKAGTPLPASQEALSLWVRDTRILKDVEERKQAELFCRRGVYRTNLPDATGKQHEYIVMYHIIVGRDSLICTYSSGDAWSPKYYPENDARRRFGDALVDAVIAAKGTGKRGRESFS